jgi:hypothetical protein
MVVVRDKLKKIKEGSKEIDDEVKNTINNMK